METFTGKCVGGPDDGRMMAHWARKKAYYAPLPHTGIITDAPVRVIEIGTYHLNEFGQWRWWATEEGRAFEHLFTADHS